MFSFIKRLFGIKAKKKYISPCRKQIGHNKYAETREFLKKKGYRLTRTKYQNGKYSVNVNGCRVVEGKNYVELREKLLQIFPFDVDFGK